MEGDFLHNAGNSILIFLICRTVAQGIRIVKGET
jgi:hypothetical protein